MTQRAQTLASDMPVAFDAGTWGAIGVVAGVVLVLVWLLEVRAPRTIEWRDTDLQGIPVQRADDLVLQHQAPNGDVWATRGYAIYRSRNGVAFERVHTVRPRFGAAWAAYLKSARTRLGYQEITEVLPLRTDVLIAFAGGDVYRIDLTTGSRSRTHRLRYFGRGKGRGVMAFGLTADDSGRIYYTEYSTLKSNRIGVWRSDDDGSSWALASDFPEGYVRHMHAVEWDAVSRGVWVASGDRNPECRIGVSLDKGRSFSWIGENSQHFRACSLLFFEQTVVWATDADHSPNTTMMLDRETRQPQPVTPLPSPTFYAQPIDERQGLLGLAQHAAEVWVVDAHGRAHPWLQWDIPRPMSGKLAGVRLARGTPSDDGMLYLNPLRTSMDSTVVFRVPTSALPRTSDA